ncbi:MAG: hypothetical protein NC548_58660, partial [Lachnospiraceae bacterium]|nr:hypothetical protein [Lachnospiraceae bacterium]
MYAKMYDAVANERIILPSGETYKGEHFPISFRMIPYTVLVEDGIHPVNAQSVDESFFSYLGIKVEFTLGESFKFLNMKAISENPLYTWYKLMMRKSTVDKESFETRYPAFLFRGFLRKFQDNFPMYLTYQ